VIEAADGITAVLPTFNRAPALRQTIGDYLRMDAVEQIVVVDDGSTDETAAFLRALDDPRVRVITHPRNRGLPAARNTGARAAATEWILYIEDDCMMPSDYAVELRRVAVAHSADIVSAPWLNVDPSDYDAARRKGQAHPVAAIDFHTYVGSFPREPVRTPFLCALSLVHRRVFDLISYDEGFRVSAFREETDFYLRAVEEGFTCVLTPTTASCQVSRWGGGTRRSRWVYELWVIRNNWRFLRRHRATLRSHGVPNIWTEQMRFGRIRLGGLVRHYAVRLRDALRTLRRG
jgi:glycosyltransferase involved in cell wall biosynthesis